MNKDELLKEIKNAPVDYDFEIDYPDLFGKYGYMVTGVSEYWKWYKSDSITDYGRSHGYKPIEEATKEELLEMLFISYKHWYQWYKNRIHDIEEEDRPEREHIINLKSVEKVTNNSIILFDTSGMSYAVNHKGLINIVNN